MRVIAAILLALFVAGCSTCQRPIQLCPQSCKPVVEQSTDTSKPVSDAWFAYSDRLTKAQVYYWLTDSAGQPVTCYRYKHDRGIFESDVWPVETTKEKPQQISMPIILKRGVSDVVIHLVRSGSSREESISLRSATLEHHNEFDVIYIE
jgi:hypothetical protein